MCCSILAKCLQVCVGLSVCEITEIALSGSRIGFCSQSSQAYGQEMAHTLTHTRVQFMHFLRSPAKFMRPV